MIVLDACVLIAHLDSSDAHHAQACRLLTEMAGQPKLISALTLAEVLVGPARVGRRRAAEAILDELNLQPREVPASAAGQLAELRAATGLRLPDCCVLLTAEIAAPAGLATFDEKLARVAASRGVVVRGGD